MAQFYFHRVVQKDGEAYVSLLEEETYEKNDTMDRVESYPLSAVQNMDVEGGVEAMMALEKWLGDGPISELLEAIFEEGYQAGKKSAAG